MSASQRKAFGLRVLVLAALALPACSMSVYARDVTYHYTDQNGTVLAETDAVGNVVAVSDRRPYGREVIGALPDGPGYTGHVGDTESALIYMQARYYDPEIARFLSIDPDPVKPGDIFSFSRTAYVNANPVGHVDPDGRACITATKEGGKSGCYVTSEEKDLANKGDWKGYYDLAGGKGNDPYARRAGEVASQKGSTPFLDALTTITTVRLVKSIVENTANTPAKSEIVNVSMENIRVALARAHVDALESRGATPNNPVQLKRDDIVKFHEAVFSDNNAGNVFGGKTWDSFPGSRALYDWCPAPSCSD